MVKRAVIEMIESNASKIQKLRISLWLQKIKPNSKESRKTPVMKTISLWDWRIPRKNDNQKNHRSHVKSKVKRN